MSRARGPRPAAIRGFAVLFVLEGLIAFAATLADIGEQIGYFSARFPRFAFDADTIIVLASARLTIVAIPVALVWFRASRFAQVMLTVFALLRLVRLPGALENGLGAEPLALAWLASLLCGLGAVALLYTPQAREWFARKGRSQADAFS